MFKMTISVCPRCNKRFTHMPWDKDVEHSCWGSDTLKEDDIPVIGNWSDADGTNGIGINKSILQTQGAENSVQFSDAFYRDGENVNKKTSRGNNVSTTRKRAHIEHIQLK